MRALNRTLRRAIAALTLAGSVAGVGVIAVASSAAATQTLAATTWVNLRAGAGTDHPVLAVVPPGATVTATGGADGRWLAVDYQGTAGYISGSYLTPTASAGDTPPATTPDATGSAITTSDVNVRSGPGTGYAVVAVAARGTTVTTTGTTSGSWTQVRWSGDARWISSAYLTRTSPTPDAPAPAASPSVVGQVRTTVDLNVRTEGHLGAPVVAVLPANSVVDVTGATTESFTQILHGGRLLWISTKYTVPVTAGPSATQPGGVAAQVVEYAKAHLGYPYQVGSKGPDAFDCSGLVAAAYASAGVLVPHSMTTQATTGTPVALADLQPGDVVVWGSPVTAVSLYTGDGQLVIADGPAYGVRQVSLSSRLSWATFAGGRRYVS
nr:SH3 domain-containing protein [Propionibacterium sp.]